MAAAATAFDEVDSYSNKNSTNKILGNDRHNAPLKIDWKPCILNCTVVVDG